MAGVGLGFYARPHAGVASPAPWPSRGVSLPSLSLPATQQVVAPDTKANRALLAAVQKNDPAAVRNAFERKASPNATVTYQHTRGAAARSSKPTPFLALVGPRESENADRPQAIAIFGQFLERGADLKATDARGRGAVLWALMLENVDLVRLVLDKGAEVNAIDPAGPGGVSTRSARCRC